MKTRRLDAYVRVSRVGGREGLSFISPDVQREQIRRWAELRGVEVAAEHVDLDQSGGHIDRPAFEKALGRVERGETGGIVVAKIDRFARSLSGALDAIHRIERAGAEFVSVAEGIDPGTPAGKMMQRLLLTLAEFELDRIRESWEVARARAIARGVHFRVPFGYVRGEDGRLALGPHAEVVRELFHRRAQGAGWTELAEWLNVAAPREIDWLPSVLPRMLRNRAYMGEAFHGDYRREDAHAAIVSPVEFDAAQVSRLAGGRSDTGPLLRGIIRCAGCRYVMKSDRGGRGTPTYRCQGRHGAGRCRSSAVVTQRIVDAYVSATFLARYGDLTLVGSQATPEVSTAVDTLAEAERELDAFATDLRLREALGHDRYVAAVEARAAAVEDARAALSDLRGVGSFNGSNGPIWPELTTPERRRLIGEGVDTVFVRRAGHAPIEDRAVVLWRGEAPSDLPGRTVRPASLVPFEWPGPLVP